MFGSWGKTGWWSGKSLGDRHPDRKLTIIAYLYGLSPLLSLSPFLRHPRVERHSRLPVPSLRASHKAAEEWITSDMGVWRNGPPGFWCTRKAERSAPSKVAMHLAADSAQCARVCLRIAKVQQACFAWGAVEQHTEKWNSCACVFGREGRGAGKERCTLSSISPFPPQTSGWLSSA